MSVETIAVYFENLGSVGGVQYNHETLVYTNSSGQRFVAVGGTSTTQQQTLTLVGSGDTVAETKDDYVSLEGNDTLTAAGSGDTVNALGANDTVTGTGVYVGLNGGDGQLLTVDGSNTIQANNSGDDITASNDAIALASGTSTIQQQTLTVYGSGDTIGETKDDYVSLEGNDTLTATGSGDTVNALGANDTVTGTGVYVGLNGGDGQLLTVDGSNTIQANNSGDWERQPRRKPLGATIIC